MPFLDDATLEAMERDLAAAHESLCPQGDLRFKAPPPVPAAPEPMAPNGVYSGLLRGRPAPRPRNPATQACVEKLKADLLAGAALAGFIVAPPEAPPQRFAVQPVADSGIIDAEFIDDDDDGDNGDNAA